MKLNFKPNLRTKLVMLFAGILILNIVLTLVFGSSLFEKMYTSSKKNEMQQDVVALKESYLNQDNATFFEKLGNLENKNLTICMFRISWGTIGIEYHTRQNTAYQGYSTATENKLKDFYLKENYKSIVGKDTVYFEVSNVGTQGGSDRYLTAFIHIGDDRFLMAETPERYLQQTANLTVRYVFYLSMLTFVIAMVVVYFVSGSISKPVRAVQQAAERISNLDFEKRCEVKSTDEIGLLAQSINHMSDRLQQSIAGLIDSNELLKDDLYRQEQSESMRRRFIASVSHDFKTPLTLIVSYAEALRDTQDDLLKEEYTNIMIEEGNKLSKLVNMLLELSKLESAATKLEVSVFSISELIKDTIHSHKILIDQQQIQVETQLDDALIVEGDYSKIERVITNLFENAVKYCGQAGLIRVSTDLTEETFCTVRIFNTGASIPQEDLDNLFVSFYRGDKARGRGSMQSYGIGLAIVKAVMDLHGRHYGVQNLENGVEFWFDLKRMDFSEQDEEE